MNLHRLTATSPMALISEMKRLWNDELIPLLRERNLASGARLHLSRSPAGTTIKCDGCGGNREAEANNSQVIAGTLSSTPQSGFGAATMTVVQPGQNGELVLTGSTVSVYVAKLF